VSGHLGAQTGARGGVLAALNAAMAGPAFSSSP